MDANGFSLWGPYAVCIGMLIVTGVCCVLMTFNLIRALIGIEILIKAVTLLLIVVGRITGHTALLQSMVITLIVIETVIITVSMGVVLGIHTRYNSLDARKIRNLKG